MNKRISKILAGLQYDEYGIWCAPVKADDQETELALRKAVAGHQYDDILGNISRHHSIEVMDHEVRRALKYYAPIGSVIVDVGGCWVWHWRTLDQLRPDITVLIVDFVKENLFHAQKILGDQVGHNIHLIHGDATCLPFPDDSISLYWSSQTLQHVPNIRLALQEGWRILKDGAWLINYSFNRAWLVEAIYRFLRKTYVVEGKANQFWLARATPTQRRIFEDVFGCPVNVRFTEILFQPNFGFRSGKEGSLLGKFDARLSNTNPFWSWLARQQSYEVKKVKENNVI